MLASYCAHLLLNELNLKCVVMIVLMLILPILGLLFWLENKLLSYNSSTEANRCDSKWKEKQDEENSSNIAQCACSFCGRLSNIATRCSRCKTAIYCSNACHVKHWRICHEYECVEIEGSQDHEESSFHGTYFLLTEAEKDNYSLSEVEQRRYEGDVYYIEGGENNVVVSDNGCAVCGNPSSKVCSRCKAIKYCSQTCQHFDWRSGHKFQCLVEKANSTEAEIVNQGRLADGNVVNLSNSNEVEDIHKKNDVEDNANSSSPLRLEFYSEGNTSSIAQIRSSFAQEATNNGNKKEVEDQLRSLEEELAKIRDENMSLRSERDEWEVRARNSIDRLYSFRKENEHQLFMMKHENELMSSSEKQARLMVNNLSQRLHCLQITVETGVEERKKQEEYIRMLQNECARVKVELQEQNKCLKRLTLVVDKTTQFPRRIAEDSRQKIVNALSEIEAVESNANCNEVSQPITLSRTPTFTRQGCSICLSNEKNMAFGCGHMTCLECGSKIRKCHICRRKITSRIRLFPD